MSGFVYWIKSEIIVAKTLQKIYNVPDPTDSASEERFQAQSLSANYGLSCRDGHDSHTISRGNSTTSYAGQLSGGLRLILCASQVGHQQERFCASPTSRRDPSVVPFEPNHGPSAIPSGHVPARRRDTASRRFLDDMYCGGASQREGLGVSQALPK